MFTFEELSRQFNERFNRDHFPQQPHTLYDPNRYFLKPAGKRLRPVLCLMGNELFDDIKQDAWNVAIAIELFHNFTLIHDDIMDKAPLRRGIPTIHAKYNESTALLAGDVMLVAAYDYLNSITLKYLPPILTLFNQTARQVCEGQQLDMDFEKKQSVSFEEYEHMIGLKTSVLLASSLALGSIIGGAGEGNQHLIYEFGKNMGLAFQVQDDYLDAFGDPKKFGKQVGGDIQSNKKTFLLIYALETANAGQREELMHLMQTDHEDKVSRVLEVFKSCKVDEWARERKQYYMDHSIAYLKDIAVLSSRKEALKELSYYLMERQN